MKTLSTLEIRKKFAVDNNLPLYKVGIIKGIPYRKWWL
jgi:hypothetical protein